MRDSGCAFKIVDTDGVRYYTSREIAGLADFARCEVLKAVAVERDIWDFLLSRFPYARIDR